MVGALAIGSMITFLLAFVVFLCTGTSAASGVRLQKLQRKPAPADPAAAPTSRAVAAYLLVCHLVVHAGVALAMDPAQRVSIGMHQTWGGRCGDDSAGTVCMSDIRYRPDMPWELCADSFESLAVNSIEYGTERVHAYAICGRKKRLGGFLFSLQAWRAPVCVSALVWLGLVVWCSVVRIGGSENEGRKKLT